MAIEFWKDLVSPKVGVVRQVAPQPRAAEEPVPPYLYVANLAHFDFRAAEPSERVGAGKGLSEQDAIAAAVGEAVERYCAFQLDPARIYLAQWADVCEAAISPPEFVLYSPQQYTKPEWPYQRWREEAKIGWIDGSELPQQRRVAVPASLTYLVHTPPQAEDAFTSATSNGLAAGMSLPAAVLAGLCELMERDAFLITWLNRLPATELDLRSSGELAARLQHHYARFSVQLRAFMLATDLPARTVVALSIDPDPARPAQVVGLGCHPDPRIALRKALFEVCQGRPAEARRFIDHPPRGRLKQYTDVKTLEDHSAFHSLPEQFREFEFLWKRGEHACIEDFSNPANGDPEHDLAHCVEALTGNGHRVAYVDLTLPDVAPCGIHVVRAIVTGLQPIHFGYDQARLGGTRLFELPARLGLAADLIDVDSLNPCPHPLA